MNEDLSDSIQSFDDEKSLEYKRENIRLKQEVENLTNQLKYILDLPKELEHFSEKNKLLTSQLHEANQKAENFQNRLKLSQQKNHDLEAKNTQIQKEFQELKLKYESCVNQQTLIQNEKDQFLKTQEEFQEGKKEKEQFFQQFSKHAGEPIKSFDEAINLYTALLENQKKQNDMNKEEIETIQKDSSQTVQKIIKKNQKLLNKIENLTNENKKLRNDLETQKQTTSSIKIALSDGQKIYESEKLDQEAKIAELSSKYDSEKMRADSLQMKLDQFVKDKEVDITRMQKNLDIKDKRIQDLNSTLTNPINQENVQIQNLIHNLGEQKLINEQLQSELSNTQVSLDSFRKKAESAALQIQKLHSDKGSMKKKLIAVTKKLAEKDGYCKDMKKQIFNLQQNINDQNVEIEDLKLQLQTASASHVEGQATLSCTIEEMNCIKKANSNIEKTIDQQRVEITKLNKERTLFVDIIHKQSSLITQYETSLHNETSKNQNLTSKIRHLEKEISEGKQALLKNQSDRYLLDLIIKNVLPLISQEKQASANQILTDITIPPMKRIQSFFRDFSRNDNIEPKIIIQNDPETSHQKDVINAVLTGFSTLLQQIANSDVQNMTDLTTFISSKMAYLKSALKEDDSMNSQFISIDYLFNGQINDRIQAINKLAKSGFSASETYDIFCANSLANIALTKILQRQKIQINDLQGDLFELLKISGCSSTEQLVEFIKELSIKSKKQLKTLHALKEELKNGSQNVQNDELISTIEEQQEKIESLENDLRTVVNDATTLQKQLEMKTQQLESLNSAHDAQRQESSKLQQKYLTEMKSFEKAIDERNAECNALRIQLSQLQEESSKTIKVLRTNINDLKSTYQAKSEKWKKAFSLIKEKKDNAEDKCKIKLRSKEKEHKEELEKMRISQEELQNKLSESIQKMKDSANEKNALAEQLSESLKQSEERNMKLSNEIGQLIQDKKDLEMKIELMDDQRNRELQVLSTQNAFKVMANETKHQEDLVNQKNKFTKERNTLIIDVLSEFDVLDKFDEDTIDEDEFKRVLHNIGSDYRRLKEDKIFSLM